MKMTVEQILQFALQQEEKKAPRAPSVEWLRERLAEHTAKPKSRREPWWQGLWQIFRGELEPLLAEKPTLIPIRVGAPKSTVSWWQRFRRWLESLLAKKPVPPHEEAGLMKPTQKSTVLRMIPARMLRKDHMYDASVEVTLPPIVDDEGHLILGVRVREMEGILAPGEILELILLAPPEGKPVGQPLELCVAKEKVLDFELPSDLRKEWQSIKDLDWSDFPFRFVLRPVNETVEVLKGEAAGTQMDDQKEKLKTLVERYSKVPKVKKPGAKEKFISFSIALGIMILFIASIVIVYYVTYHVAKDYYNKSMAKEMSNYFTLYEAVIMEGITVQKARDRALTAAIIYFFASPAIIVWVISKRKRHK